MNPGKYRNIFWLVIIILLIFSGMPNIKAQGPDDYFLGHGFADGDTVFTNSGTFWDDGYTFDYSPTGNWTVYFCTTAGNPNPITVEFSGFATHYGGAFPAPPGAYAAWDYLNVRYNPSANYFAYHDDTPEFSFTSQDGCIQFNMVTNGDPQAHQGWEAEIYAIPPPVNNGPCGAALLTVGNTCTPQVFSNKGAYYTAAYPSPCHSYFGGDVWFKAVVPASQNLTIESFAGTLDWAVMNIYTGSSCTGLSHYACVEDSIGMPVAHLTGFTPGDTVFIRMFGDQAKSGTFGMCASDPVSSIDGHTGPGGVGDDSTNLVWLRSDMGLLNNSDADAANGQAVKTWKDQSGNGNDLTQTTGSQQALKTDAVINSLPVLRMDGTDDYMTAELTTLSAPLTLIAVSRFTASGNDVHLLSIGDEINAAKSVSISRETNDNYYTYTNNTKYYGSALSDNTPYLIHAVHDIAPPRHELYLNETSLSPTDYPTSVITDGSLKLGASRATSDFFGGDVAELIIYRRNLNSAQKIIVENSLSSKYNIPITTDKYILDGVHKFDVAGIGRVDASNLHTEAQSNRTLSIGNPTDLDNGEFILFGHDNADMSNWTSTERPNDDPNLQRVAREWRVNITGGAPGALTLSLSDSILPAQLPGFNNYSLWTDTDGDFSSGATAIPLVQINGDYVANSVTFTDGIYLTIGTIMPVVSFSADSSEGLESVANPSMEVSLNYAVNSEMSVVFRGVDGTATGGGVDYLLNPGSAVFAAGSTTANIVPSIVDDTIVEIPDEYFNIILSDPDPGLTLSADSVHTYTILNNDINVSATTDTDTIGDCGTLSANLSTSVEGTGPYSYSWDPATGLSSGGIANPVATPTTDTWYKVTVTDLTNGAVGIDSIHITVIPGPVKPVITPGGATTFCEGDSVQLTSSAGFSYLWSNGKTTQDIYVGTAGSYTVKVTDEYGCESPLSDPEVITVNPIPSTPTISPSDTSICPGDSANLVSSAGDSWLWSTGETTQDIHVKTAGDYYVRTRSAAGCWSDTSLLSTLSLKTPPPAPTITASGGTDLCPGDSVDLTSSTGDTYLWSTGETTEMIRVKTAGSFTVQITDGTSCLSDSSLATVVTIKTPPPAPTITPPGSVGICPGDSIDLTSSAGDTWLWSTGETTQSIRVKTAGSFTVQITDATTCQSPVSVATDITIKTPPPAPTISTSGPVDICPGDSVDLTSSAGDTYLWSNGETSQSIRVKTDGVFSVRVTDATTCLSPASADTTVSLLSPPPAPTITASGPTSFCPGDSVDLTSSTGDTYLWSNGETTASIRVKTDGSFSVQVTDASTCISSASTATDVILHPVPSAPTITPGGSTDVCENDSVELSSSAGSLYLWSTGETTQTIYAKIADSYTVLITNPEGCWSTASAATTITTQAAPAKPTISYTGSTEFCMGDSLVLTSSAGTTYLWSSGETSQSITAKTTALYSVRIANALGCLSLDSDPVDVRAHDLPPKPVITGDTEYCAGDSVELNAPAAITYSWSTGEITQNIYVKSGSYTLTVRNNNGCESPVSDPYVITENPLPAKPAISGDSNYCQGGSTSLTAGAATSYSWSSGETTQSISATAGSYTVSVGDANGCISPASDPFPVTENPKPAKPTISADGPLDFWLGDSVTLSSSAASGYLWSPTAETSSQIVVKTAGTYSVIITDLNGCLSDASDAVTITVNSLEKPVIIVGGETSFCEGSPAATLSAPDAFAWLWSSGETIQTISPIVSGSYTVTVSNSEGHSSEPSDPVTITVNLNPSVSLVSRTDILCYGESTGSAVVVGSGGTEPYSYGWSEGQSGTVANNLAAGDYVATITDANLCQDTVNVSITESEALLVEETILDPFCDDSYDGSIEISVSGGTPAYYITWSDGSLGMRLEDLGPGTLDLEVIDENQCRVTTSYTLTSSEDNCVKIYEIITPNGDGYNDVWEIPGLEYYPGATVEVYDQWGKQVFYSGNYDQPWDGSYDGKVLPMASYHYVINLNNGSPVRIGNITIMK